MNLILEKSEKIKYFTNMKQMFFALGNICEDFDWYISDIETNKYIPGEFDSSNKWITGKELNAILNKYEIQFIWAVFSAFKKGTKQLIEKPPSVEDNPAYWSGKEPDTQIRNAEFELACWDSSALILVGISDEMASKFCKTFPETISLVSAAR